MRDVRGSKCADMVCTQRNGRALRANREGRSAMVHLHTGDWISSIGWYRKRRRTTGYMGVGRRLSTASNFP